MSEHIGEQLVSSRSGNTPLKLGIALAALLVLDQMGGKKLKGHRTVKSSVGPLVHHTHPALTELLGDLVVADGAADHDGPILPRKLRWREQPIRPTMRSYHR